MSVLSVRVADARRVDVELGWQLVEALKLHRRLDGTAAQAEALRLLDQVGISGAKRRLGDFPHQLSGGLNQRVMMAEGGKAAATSGGFFKK